MYSLATENVSNFSNNTAYKYKSDLSWAKQQLDQSSKFM